MDCNIYMCIFVININRMEWILFSIMVIGFLGWIGYKGASSIYNYTGWGLYLNKFTSHYFTLGVTSYHSHTEAGECIDVLEIGLLFITFQMVFFNGTGNEQITGEN